MASNYITYEFNTDSVIYPAVYNSTKLNLGHLMQKETDSTGKIYVSPIEPKFIRGREIIAVTPFSSNQTNFNTLGTLKYDADTMWCFATRGESNTTGAQTRRIFFFIYKKSTNEIINTYQSINVSFNPNTFHQCYSIQPTLDLHTTGSVEVFGTLVTGSGTSWQTDGACVGNRIGFGSTSSADITTWYEISSITNNTTLNITNGVSTDGIPNNLNLTGSIPYVIEDFRLCYANRGSNTATSRSVILIKGLRPEIFAISPITIPAATTVDNLRAGYRLVDGATTSATFTPISSVLEPKISFTEQYLYTVSKPNNTTISIQKFNIRAALTLTDGRSNSAFSFTTGNQTHGGTNTSETDVMVKDNSGNYYVSHYTRISRIPTGSIAAASTTFIADNMIETPPGTSTTFANSAQLADICYMPEIDRIYISHLQGTIRNYITRYISGGQFETLVHANDQIQQSTYLVNEFETLTPHLLSTRVSAYYNDGVMFVVRDAGVSSNNNIIYTLPLEADAQFETTSSACVITPELFTTSASMYSGIYVDSTDYFNTPRFALPRQPYYLYYRTSGISDNSGTWNYLDPSGSMPTATESIQFKLTFSTLGYYSMPALIHGITVTYSSSLPQQAVSNFDAIPTETDISTQTFAWRQSSLFNTTPADMYVSIYSGSTPILTDSIVAADSGSWEYSVNAGNTWNALTGSINNVGHYIRYTATPALPSESILKTILYI
jgi:hypothetical protein